MSHVPKGVRREEVMADVMCGLAWSKRPVNCARNSKGVLLESHDATTLQVLPIPTIMIVHYGL